MKQAIVSLLILASIVCNASTLYCTNLITSLGSTYTNYNYLQFTPVNQYPIPSGGSTVLPVPFKAYLDTNGNYGFTNTVSIGGFYSFRGYPQNIYIKDGLILIPSNDTNSYTLNQAMANASTGWAVLYSVSPIFTNSSVVNNFYTNNFATNALYASYATNAAPGSPIVTNNQGYVTVGGTFFGFLTDGNQTNAQFAPQNNGSFTFNDLVHGNAAIVTIPSNGTLGVNATSANTAATATNRPDGTALNSLPTLTQTTNIALAQAQQVASTNTNPNVITNTQTGVTLSGTFNATGGNVVTFSNATINTTNKGFYFSGWPTNFLNGSWLLSITNQGNGASAFAIFTNTTATNAFLVLNPAADQGNWDIFDVRNGTTNLIYYDDGDLDPTAGWANMDPSGGAPGTVIRSNFVTVATQSSVSAGTNRFYSTSPFSPAFNYANAVFLDTNASVAGVRGNPALPFSKVEDAQAAARSGDAYVFAPNQRFYLWFDFRPTNAVLIGNGSTLVASDTNQTFFGTTCYPGFWPVGSCRIYSLNYYMPDYNGSSFLINTCTNFAAYDSVLESGSFFSYSQSFSVYTNTRIEYNSCRINCGDLNQILIAGPDNSTNSVEAHFQNVTFQPRDFNGQYTAHASAVWPQVIEVKNAKAFINGCTFDYSQCWTNNSGQNFTNASAILANTNARVWLGGNIFNMKSTNGFSANPVRFKGNGQIYGTTNGF